jgi:hypothetical protein
MKLIKGFAQFVTENLHISADSMQILTDIKLEIEDQLPDWDTTLATGDREMMVIYVENPEDPEQDYYMVTLDDAAEMATITKGTGSVNSPSKTVPANPRAVAKALVKMTNPRYSDSSMDMLEEIKMKIEDRFPEWNTTLATGDSDMPVIYVENPEDPEQDYYMVTIEGEMATITKGTGSVNSPSKTVPANPRAVAKALATMIR